MSYKVLHIMDCFLPETMNWLEKLLEESLGECEHHIYADYYIRPLNPKFNYVNAGIKSSYPIPLLSKLKNNLLHSVNSKILLDYILKHQIKLIHFHFGHIAIQYKNWIQKTGLPFCISLYGFDYEYLVYKNPQVKSDYFFLSRLGGIFIVEGKYSKKVVQNYGVPEGQIRIVHMLFDRRIEQSNGQPIWQLWKVAKFSSIEEPIRLFQAATFTEKKNQLGLVEALQDHHSSRFVISFYGEPHDKNYFAEVLKAVKSKSKHCIQIRDKVNLSEYLNALSETHFAINLSKRSQTNDTEGGCPVFLKDGLSLGIPAISTNHCDIPEIVVNGCNGYLLPENDIPAITDLLDQLLLLSRKEYIQLCSNAAESVKTNIQQKITRHDLLKVYQSLL